MVPCVSRPSTRTRPRKRYEALSMQYIVIGAVVFFVLVQVVGLIKDIKARKEKKRAKSSVPDEKIDKEMKN